MTLWTPALSATDLEVTDVPLPGWDAATASVMTILGSEAWRVHAKLWQQHGDELSPDVSARLKDSSSLTAEDTAAAWQEAQQWDLELVEVFTGVDVLALPTLAAAPPPWRTQGG